LRPGVVALLNYYNKPASPPAVNFLMNAFEFADVPAWHIDLRAPDARLKVLVTIPAKYLDALPDRDVSLEDDPVAQGTTQIIFFASSEVEKQIEDLISLMRGYNKSASWKKAKSFYAGPYPDYDEYSFDKEIENLNLFVSNIRRFLTLNGLALRRGADDTIEIGLDDEFRMTYILINSSEFGSKVLRIGFNRLRGTYPFTYPRTMAYAQKLGGISNEISRSGELNGGWKRLLETHTVPPPEFKKEKKEGKCKPTLSNPFKCIPDELREYFDRNKTVFKCDHIPPNKRFYPGAAAGSAVWDAIATGEADGYKNKYAPHKTRAIVEIEGGDIDKFRREVEIERGVQYDFVGDPFIEKMYKDLKNLELQSAGEAVLDKIVTDVAAKFDISEISRRILDCYCAETERVIKNLEDKGLYNDADFFRLRAAAMGCQDPCGVVPILCSCLPFEFPLKISIPDDFPVVDIMAYLGALILDAIITALIDFLIGFLTRLLNRLLDCERDGETKNTFIDFFNNTYPFDDDLFTGEEIDDAFRRNELPGQAINPEILSLLVRDVSLLLTPREFCSLLGGTATINALEIVEALIREKYPDVAAMFSNTERIRRLFITIGELIDSEICDNLIELLDVSDRQPGNFICDETDLREDLVDGRATIEQIQELLNQALECNTNQVQDIMNVIQDVGVDGDFMSSIIPAIFQTPSSPNGLIPRDPPSVQFLQTVAQDSVFDSIEVTFDGEMDGNITTLITTWSPPYTAPSDEEEPSNVQRVFDLFGIPATVATPPNPTGGTLANKIKARLRGELGREITFDRFNGGMALEDVLIEQNRWFISLDLDHRTRKVERPDSNLDIGDNLLELVSGVGLIPDFSTTETTSIEVIHEDLRIVYALCPPSGVAWSEILDAYTVMLKDIGAQRYPTGEKIIFGFDQRKEIKPEILSIVGRHPLKGIYSAPQEAFAQYTVDKWASQTAINSEAIIAEMRDLQGTWGEFHADYFFTKLSEDLIQRIARDVAKSRLLEGSLEDQIDSLAELQLATDPSCDPRPPGLLNIPDVRGRLRKMFDNAEGSHLDRYVFSTTYGLALIFIRVYAAHLLLNGLFPFSRFRVQDLLKSDIIMRYFLNRFKEDILNTSLNPSELRYMLYNLPDDDINFYERLSGRLKQALLQQVETFEEPIRDPITNEEINILFRDESLTEAVVQELREGSIWSPVDLGNSCERDAQASLLQQLFCFDVPDEMLTGEISSGDIDPETGLRNLGFMEYIVKDQFKVLGDELEATLQTDIFSLDRQFLGTYAKIIDVPHFSGRNPDDPDYWGANERGLVTRSRFFKDPGLFGEGIDEDVLEAVGFADASRSFPYREVYEDRYTVSQPNAPRVPDRTDVTLPELLWALSVRKRYPISGPGGEFPERLVRGRRAISEQDEIFQRELGPESFQRYNRAGGFRYTDEQGGIGVRMERRHTSVAAFEGEIAQLLTGEIREFLQDLQGEELSASSLKSRWSHLSDGGFVTEKYIKIHDHPNIVQIINAHGGPEDLAGGGEWIDRKIKNRPASLKGVVNINHWREYIISLILDGNKPEPAKLLITNQEGRRVFNIGEFFEKWEFGLRLALVYPLLGLPGSLNTFGQDRFLESYGNGLHGPNPALKNNVLRDKAYFYFERTSINIDDLAEDLVALGVLPEDDPRELARVLRRDVDTTTLARQVWTLPLISKEREVSADELSTFIPAPTSEGLIGQLEIIERALNTLVPEDLRNTYERYRGEFNNLILPLGDPRKDSRYPGYELTYLWAGRIPVNLRFERWHLDTTGQPIMGIGTQTDPERFINIRDTNSAHASDLGLRTNAGQIQIQAAMKERITRLSRILFGWDMFLSYERGDVTSLQQPNGEIIQYNDAPERSPKGPPKSPEIRIQLRFPSPDIQDSVWEAPMAPPAEWYIISEEERNQGAVSGKFWRERVVRMPNQPPHQRRGWLDFAGRLIDSQHWSYAHRYRGGLRFIMNHRDLQRWQGPLESRTFNWKGYENCMAYLSAAKEYIRNNNVTSFDDLVGEYVAYDTSYQIKEQLIDITETVLGQSRNQLRTRDNGGISPVIRCFVPADELEIHRTGDENCQAYDQLTLNIDVLQHLIDTNFGSLPDQNDLGNFFEDFNELYRQVYLPGLRQDVIDDAEYAMVSEYMFPLSRYLSLISMYCIEHTAGLPGRRELFDQTKSLIQHLYFTVLKSSQGDWWRKKRKRPTRWWERPLTLPFPLILLLSPWKILQALFILVPPLKWILGMADFKFPRLPPHRKKKGDPCE
jgi:hypothetical protein